MPKEIEPNLEGVADLLDLHRHGATGGYCLTVANGKIHLTEGRLARPGHEILCPITASDINKGPTPQVWGVIAARIRNLKEKGKL